MINPSKTLGTLLTALLLVVIAGCAGAKKKEVAPTPKQEAVNQLDVERDRYVKQTQSRIDTINDFSNDLEKRAETQDKVQAKKLENAAEDIDSLLEDAREELADVKEAKAQNWVDEKRDVEESMNRAESLYSASVQLLK